MDNVENLIILSRAGPNIVDCMAHLSAHGQITIILGMGKNVKYHI